MRWPSAWLAGCSCAALLAGCGGHAAAPPPKPPRIPPAVAQQLAADADAVAALSGCSGHDAAMKLQRDTIAAIGSQPSESGGWYTRTCYFSDGSGGMTSIVWLNSPPAVILTGEVTVSVKPAGAEGVPSSSITVNVTADVDADQLTVDGGGDD